MSTPIEELTAREQEEGRKATLPPQATSNPNPPTSVFPVAATIVSNQPVEVPKPAVVTTGVVTSEPPTPTFLQHLEDEIKEKLGK